MRETTCNILACNLLEIWQSCLKVLTLFKQGMAHFPPILHSQRVSVLEMILFLIKEEPNIKIKYHPSFEENLVEKANKLQSSERRASLQGY